MHRHGWTVTTTVDGWFTITSPNGHQLESQRHGRARSPNERAGP